MPAPADKLAASREQLRELQKDGRRIFRSSEMTRVHRERLLKNGFLREVIKGWLMSSSPGSDPGDTTPWYASFWKFCARYCEARFGDRWYVSPEQSLLLHAENTVVPQKIIIYSPDGTNNTVQLPFGTSLYDLKHGQTPPAVDLTEREGVRLYTPDAALTKVSESFLASNPVEAQIVLRGIRDSSDLLRHLLDGGHSTVAGRLAGAFRKVGRADVAEDIVAAMRAADYDVRESDPFEPDQTFGARGGAAAPIIERLRALWEACREPVINVFPSAPGLPVDQRSYLRRVDENYRSDAYHSLSIEGYRVTPEMIERVQAGDWDPDNHDADRLNRDALAARGYWQAFQLVRDDVAKIIAGDESVAFVSSSHRDWYRELFQPCVAAGLISPSALAGYRNDAVFLRGSRHVPPRSEAVRDAMPALFALLAEEAEPSVRAVLGHWLFGYIHPYPDGNGRMARFLMNAMLASGGYPWTVIRVEDRDDYLTALERASVNADIVPFAKFIAERVEHSM